MLRDRAIDKDDHVRCMALESIGKCIHRASEFLLKQLSSRLLDRKPQVRRAALAQVCQIYTNANPSSYSRPASAKEASEERESSMDWERSKSSNGEGRARARPRSSIEPSTMNDVLETRMLKLPWLPDVILRAHGSLNEAGDQKSARDIEKLIFEQIPAISKDNGANVRAGLRRLAIFTSQLSPATFAQLSAIVRSRWSTRARLETIAQFRLSSRRSATSANRVEKQATPVHPTFSRKNQAEDQDTSLAAAQPTIELRNHAFALASLLSARIGSPIDLENCQKLCMTFATAADLKIFDKILKAIHPLSTPAEVANARQDVVSRLGSKSAEGLFFTDHVFPVCCAGVFSGSYFSAACDIAKEESSNPLIDWEMNGALTQMATESGKRVLPGILRFLDIVGADCNEVLGLKAGEIRSLLGVQLEVSDSSADVILCGMRMICQLPVGSIAEAADEELLEKLQKHMMAASLVRPDRGGKLSKWACRAYISLKRNDSDALTKLGRELTVKLDSFTGRMETIVAPLAALSQLAKHASTCFKSCALECFDFSRALLSGTMNSLIHSAQGMIDEDEALSRDVEEMKKVMSTSHIFGPETGPLAAEMFDRRTLCLAEVVQRAVKLLVYSLAFQDDEESLAVIDILMRICDDTNGDVFSVSSFTKKEPQDEVKVENREELSVVKKEADEEIPGQANGAANPSLEAAFAVCRLCSGRGVMYLSRQPRFFKRVTPHVFVTTLLLAQDSSATVRLSFSKSVYSSIIRKKLQLRWSVALGLMAVDPVMENVGQIRSMLSSMFRYRRKVYNHARQKGKSASLQLLPESAVPELIWVLAHLPGVGVDQEAGFMESQKCLDLFLDRLLESNEHAGILNEYIETLSIAQVASDRDGNQGTEYVIELSRIAGGILRKKQSGRKWNLSDIPGRVALPADMFDETAERKGKSTDVVRPSLVELARKLDDKDVVESTKNTPGPIVSDVKVSTGGSTGKSKKRRSKKTEDSKKKLFDGLMKLESRMEDEEGSKVQSEERETEESKVQSEEKETEESKAQSEEKKMEESTVRRSKRKSRGRKRRSEELEDAVQEEKRTVVRRSARNRRL
ncbi:Sister chromatid cohesion protein Pds5 [Gracilaria domingensis]|nr:Sister chromatid cohesion protein Pds5 [Gracilaria domingensis]